MSRLEEARKRYDEVPVPGELESRIEKEIAKAAEKRKGYKYRKVLRYGCAAVIAICLLFTGGLNVSEAFATEVAKLPVIGQVAKVLTFRSYEAQTDDIAVDVKIPSIEMIEENTGIKVDEVNQKILNCCNEYANEAMAVAREYRTAFLETGGTEEEWAEHNILITVDYEVLSQSNDYLSFAVIGSQSWTGGYTEKIYYNISLSTGEEVSLEDILGIDYVDIANTCIREQIAQREENGDVFFTEEEGGFTTVTEDTKFYINEKEIPVVVFEKYEVAPGSMGDVEFEIAQ